MAYCENCGKQISDQAMACPSCGHPGPGARAAQVAVTSGGDGSYAGWWQRVGASFIDGLVIGIPSAIAMAVIGVGIAANSEDFSFDPETGELVAGSSVMAGFIGSFVVLTLMGILYRVLMEGSPGGQTLGKMAMKIKVCDAQTGGPIGYGRALIRWLVASVLWLVFYIPGIVDALFPLWDTRKQTIHDKAARSVVVMAR